MTRKLHLIFALLCLGISPVLLAQNRVLNPSFEFGSPITDPGQLNNADFWSDDCTDYDPMAEGPDVFEATSVNPDAGVPNNIYGSMPERTGQEHYGHVYSRGATPSLDFWREAMKGTLDAPLEQGCYNFSFYAVSDLGPFHPLVFDDQILEVLLVSGGNCTGKLIYTTPSIPDNNTWNLYSTSFNISASEAGLYDRILIRPYDNGEVHSISYVQTVFVDDFSITNGGGTLLITADHAICPGETTTLTTSPGFDNYLWSNGATTQSTTVGTAGTYTVSAWNDGDECESTASVTITLHELPKIKMPKIIYACNELFTMLCAPSPPVGGSYSYQWWGPDPVDDISTLLSTDQCFIPEDYGSYLLVVTDDVTGCTVTHSFTIAPTIFPVFNLKDVYYCKEVPIILGLNFPVADATGYSWTYNGDVVPGANSYNLPNMGDGEYCLTIYWGKGCFTTQCFTVEECCEPNPQFNFSFNLTGSPKSVTVSNDPLLTDDYDMEQYWLYRYCGSETDPTMMTWTLVGSMSRTTGFNTPYTFSGAMIMEGCWYRIVHAVTSDCIQKSFVYNQYHYAGSLKFTVGPNPVQRGEQFRVQLDSEIEGEAEVEVTDLISGQVVLRGSVSNQRPFTGVIMPRRENSLYAVRVSTATETVVKQLMVK
ncbi:MAG: hypothetical protein AAFQ98_00440 [Bacteroidota bacterium]